jgi:tRNA wybutosine-synthesizing protein 3
MQPPSDTRFAMTKTNARTALETAIREKKIDPLMIPISQYLAKTTDYFTTSTCSGRITLMDLEKNEKKREGAFYRKWHRKVKFSEMWKGIEEHAHTGNLWFKQDAFVYVIGMRTLEQAKKIIAVCQKAGIKRYGVHHFEEGKVLMEIFGTHSMSVPLTEGKKRLADKEYVKKILQIANRKWDANEKKRKAFEKELRGMIR